MCSTKHFAVSVPTKFKTVVCTVVFSLVAAGFAACSAQPETTEQSADQAQEGYVTDEFFTAIERSDLAKVR